MGCNLKVWPCSQSHRLLSNLRRTTYVVLAGSLILSTACKSAILPSWRLPHFLPALPDANEKKTQGKTVHQLPDEASVVPTSLPPANPSIVMAAELEQVPQSASADLVSSEIAETSVTVSLGSAALEAPNAAPNAAPIETKPAAESMNRTAVASESAPKLVITGVRPERGVVKVAIYTTQNEFLSPGGATQTFELAAKNSTVETNLRRFSQFAVAVYQDFDSNGKLSRNSAGIPTEPFAFSNNAMGKRGPPSFDQAAVQLPKKDASSDEAPFVVSINLP